jgi:phosphoribosylglycinamide formyltransferase-1
MSDRAPSLDLGVLVSGRGSNLQAILDAIADGALDARVRLVISNKPGAQALERAEKAGVTTRTIPHRGFESREAFDAALVEALREAGVQWVVLAGFMRLLTPTFLGAFGGRILNIHPSLLPAFPGAHAHRDAIDYGVKVTGCTVHLVDEGVDTGPIVAQRAIAVRDDDDEQSLAARLLHEEHALLVEVLRWIAADRLTVEPGSEGRRPRGITRPA